MSTIKWQWLLEAPCNRRCQIKPTKSLQIYGKTTKCTTCNVSQQLGLVRLWSTVAGNGIAFANWTFWCFQRWNLHTKRTRVCKVHVNESTKRSISTDNKRRNKSTLPDCKILVYVPFRGDWGWETQDFCSWPPSEMMELAQAWHRRTPQQPTPWGHSCYWPGHGEPGTEVKQPQAVESERAHTQYLITQCSSLNKDSQCHNNGERTVEKLQSNTSERPKKPLNWASAEFSWEGNK